MFDTAQARLGPPLPLGFGLRRHLPLRQGPLITRLAVQALPCQASSGNRRKSRATPAAGSLVPRPHSTRAYSHHTLLRSQQAPLQRHQPPSWSKARTPRGHAQLRLRPALLLAHLHKQHRLLHQWWPRRLPLVALRVLPSQAQPQALAREHLRLSGGPRRVRGPAGSLCTGPRAGGLLLQM